MPKPPAAYTRTAVWLHWTIALLIFAAFALGVYMHDLPLSPDKLRLFSYHKWIGITALTLAVVRAAWRLLYRPPDPPATDDPQHAWYHRLHRADGRPIPDDDEAVRAGKVPHGFRAFETVDPGSAAG